MRRKFLISLLLFLIFVSVCIYALVTAQGTKIGSDGTIVSTSIIRINSTPQDVTVYINDQKAIKNENRVEWLQPGTVKVSLKKAGYRTWEKTLDLQAGVIEDIYAQLYPESLNFDKLTSVNVDNFFFSNNSDFIFYSVINGENANDNGLWKLKLRRNLLDIGEIVPVKSYAFSQDQLSKMQKNEYSLKITDDATKVLLDIPILNEIYYIDLNNPTPISIVDLLTFYPTKIEWLRNSNMLIASNGSLLVSYDINSRDQNLIYYSPDKDILYSISANEVYFFRSDKQHLYNLSGSQSNKVVLPNNYKGSELISNIYSAKDNNDIFYTLENGNLHFVDLEKNVSIPFDSIEEVLSIAQNGKSLTFTGTDNQIRSIVFKDSLDFKTYTYTIHNIGLTRESLNNIAYTPSGKNIVTSVTDTVGKRNIWFMDNDGQNSIQLITNEKLATDKIGINDNGLSIYTLLEDQSDLVENASVKNVYKFDLEVK